MSGLYGRPPGFVQVMLFNVFFFQMTRACQTSFLSLNDTTRDSPLFSDLKMKCNLVLQTKCSLMIPEYNYDKIAERLLTPFGFHWASNALRLHVCSAHPTQTHSRRICQFETCQWCFTSLLCPLIVCCIQLNYVGLSNI